MSRSPIFHPQRKEHAESFIAVLADEPSRRYGTATLEYIWRGGKRPIPPRKLKKDRVREIDAALYAMFATVR